MELLAWLPTAAITGLGYVLWRKLEGQDKTMEELRRMAGELREMMATELRGMDVRITRIESQLWIDRDRHK